MTQDRITLEQIQEALLTLKNYCSSIPKTNRCCPSECALCKNGYCIVTNEEFFNTPSDWKIHTLNKPPIHKFFN